MPKKSKKSKSKKIVAKIPADIMNKCEMIADGNDGRMKACMKRMMAQKGMMMKKEDMDAMMKEKMA